MPRNRSNSVHVYLSDIEKQRLTEYAKKCNVSESGYLRRLLLGIAPSEFPPGDYAAILQSMLDIANDLQDIARVAKEIGDIDSENIGKLMKNQYSLVRELTEEAYQTSPLLSGKGTKMIRDGQQIPIAELPESLEESCRPIDTEGA